MDSSRVSTFLISILLIVYGSFRSLNMEQEAREREKEKERSNLLSGLTSSSCSVNGECSNNGSVQTLDTMHALCLPLGASISLLVMFFFFDSMQMLFAICTASEYTIKAPPPPPPKSISAKHFTFVWRSSFDMLSKWLVCIMWNLNFSYCFQVAK